MERKREILYGSTCFTSKRIGRIHKELPDHVLESIFERLHLLDLVRAKAVCSSWKFNAEVVLSRFSKAPWLFFPYQENNPNTCLVDINGFINLEESVDINGFINLEEGVVYRLMKKTVVSRAFSKFPCIGSSHGWLIFLDATTSSPILLNPFTEVQIHLPSLNSFLFFSKFGYWKRLKQYLVLKAILTSEPAGEFGVVLICTSPRKLGFYKNGNDSWMELNGDYEDIICCRNQLYALHFCWSASVDIWDLGTCPPTKRIAITANDHPRKSLDKAYYFRNGQNNPLQVLGYLVESQGEILLVLRFLIDSDSFVNEDDYDDVNRTLLFHVYKLDSEEKKWVEVTSLGDRAVFVGVNHSISISTEDLRNCKRNSIYFTGNYWLDVNWYGHDTGIYSLGDEDGIVSSISKFVSKDVQPTCWVVPNCMHNA